MGSLSVSHDEMAGSNHPAGPVLQPLAIIGLSFRFPQEAVNAKEFWRMMIEKRCASTNTPSDRFDLNVHHHPDNNRTESLSIRGGHFMTGDLSAFDAPFFSIGATEAEAMDPAQRLTLETAYRALENAGIPLERLAGSKTCVYSGSFSRDYATMLDHDPDMQPKYRATGTATNMLANRVSWFFDLKGPSVNVDTACSSSLVAMDLACQSIWSGDSTMGLACGSNAMFTPEFGMALDNLGMLGKDSRCFSFDHRANGYARGEGFGVLVIKPLDAALRDGDTIRAVVRSTCSNQDGKTPQGVTQPSREAQERLIIDAYAKAGLDMSVTRYFEAHGTGTPVGDPIEAGAIGAAFRRFRSPEDPLYVGSVKSNIGHLEGASGVAGVIKAILALEAGVIPPNSNFEKLNPKIDAEFFNIKIATDPIPWPSTGLRRASVQSFGFGGANSHVILDDAFNYLRMHGLNGSHNTIPEPPYHPGDLAEVLSDHAHGANGVYGVKIGHHVNGLNGNGSTHLNNTDGPISVASTPQTSNGLTNGHKPTAVDPASPRVLVWSMADEHGVKRLADVWRDYLSGLDLSRHHAAHFAKDLAYTLATRRSQFAWRTFAVTKSLDNLSTLADTMKTPIRASISPKLAFVLTGQGSQWFAMGRELLSRYPVYRNSLIDAGMYLKGLGCSWEPVDELLRSETTTKINNAMYSQTLCTAVQVALVDLLDSLSIRPAAVVGHSSGEIAAAYAANAFSRQVAWKIAYYRGVLAAKLAKTSSTKGAMLAAGLSAKEAQVYLKQVADKLSAPGEKSRLGVACVNSPKSVTISGDEIHIDHLQTLLEATGVFARKLKVDVAYHSFQMQEVADEYLAALGTLGVGSLSTKVATKSAVTMASSVTGTWITRAELASPTYWVRNLVSPVLFSDALAVVCSKSESKTIGPKKLDGSHLQAISISEIVEVGPHSALQGPVKDILSSIGQDKTINYMSVLARNKSAVDTVLEVTGRLYCLGYPVNLARVNLEPEPVVKIGSKKRSAFGRTSSGTGLKALSTLPEYPFNHTKSYWAESRISKDYRFRRFIRHDLVGVQASDWNPLEARWRNTIRLSDLPWVEDHKINNTILYPAAGMLVMAIEACKQLADPTKQLSGYLFKSVAFHSALNIPTDSAGIEVNLCMRPRKDQNEKDEGWHDFRLYMYRDGKWHENCNGAIQLVYKVPDTEVAPGREESAWREASREKYFHAIERCKEHVDADWLYARMADCGYNYGPTFRAIKALAHNGDDATVAEVETYQWANYYDGTNPDQPHVIHPTTLDCILQGVLTVHMKGGTEKISTAIPTHVDRLWISGSGLSYADAEKVNVYTTGRRTGMRETESSLIALDATGTHVLIDAECFKSTDVASDDTEEDDAQQNITPNLCHTVDWKPDFELLSAAEIQAFCDHSVPAAQEPEEFFTAVDFLLTSYIRRSLQSIESRLRSEQLDLKPHTQAYLDWMRHRIQLLESGQSPFASPEWRARLDDSDYIRRVEAQIADTNKQGLFYTTVGRDHAKLLTGEMDALNLLFEGDLVKDHYYEIEETAPCMARLRAFLDVLVHKNPGAKFLELGAGTGAMTHQLMKTLTTHGDGETCNPRYGRYDYTDLSPFFFGAAQDKYRSHRGRMQFKTLNIETDPEAQDFECGTYDAVFAAAVLHATSDLATTLKNCRKLLKPGGKLVLFEPTMSKDGLRTNFAFGLLEGWWLSSEPYRKLGPCLDESQWNDLFQQTGFSGTDTVLYDYEDAPCHEFSVLISTAVESTTAEDESTAAQVTILYGAEQESLALQVQSRFKATGQQYFSGVQISSTVHDPSLSLEGTTTLVSLLELSSPVWYNIDASLYERLQKLLTSSTSTKVVWVCQSGRQKGIEDDESPPAYRLIDGLSRVLNSEVDGAALTCVTLDSGLQQNSLKTRQIDHIADVSKRLHLSSSSEHEFDTEYSEINGMLHIPRLIETTSLNEEIYRRVLPRQVVSRKWADGVPLRLIVGSPGLLNTLHFIEDQERDKPLNPDEVEIEVRSVGLNFRDLLIALGRLQQATVGCEAAGVITRMGANVKTLRVGDRVATCPFDSYKSFVRIDHRAVAKVPDSIPFAVAAAVPVNYITAWLAFRTLARLQPGETVLIHSAAGGTGQAAIQVAQYMGATVLATVGSEAKKTLMMDHYGIPEGHIFSSRDPASFAKGVRRATKGRGADVVFNSLSGEGLVASWECIAPYGRFVEIGKKDILARNQLPMLQFEKNVSFTALDISQFSRDRPHVGREAMEEVFALIAEGKLAPAQPLQVYGVSELEKAFRTMQGGKTFGKATIEMRPDDIVEAALDTKPSFSLTKDATFVIAGGLGGIGRSIAAWLVERGARNLILLSRSGASNPHAQALVDELTSKGACVQTPGCDISDKNALESTLAACLKNANMPPIKGCIQASMVLRDAAFAGMTHEAWTAATAPKVQGSWNLHTVLPSDLDFFVTLSSITGVVGSRGQANYAAGNAFQDALVHHRIAHGQRAAAIDLGPFFSIGVMTENAELKARWEEMVDAPVTEADLFALLDYYCNPAEDSQGRDGANSAPLRCQAVVGLARWLSDKTALYFKKPMMRNLTMDQDGTGAAGADRGDSHRVNFAAVFAGAESLGEVVEAVTDALTRKMASTLSLSREEIDLATPMHSYGVDSLVAVELRNWFAKELHADVAIFDILGGATISTASVLAATKSKYRKAEWAE